MAFHLTTGASDDVRVHSFGTLPEAIASQMLAAAAGGRHDGAAFILEVPDGDTLGGRLAAGRDAELGWVEVDPDEPVPEWWHELSERAQRWILENPRGDLPAWMVEEAAKSGAGAISVYWVDHGPNGVFNLHIAEQDWATRRSLVEAYERG